MGISDKDMRDEVKRALGSDVRDYDVNGIVDDIQRKHGTVSIDAVEPGEFWATAGKRAH